VWLDPGYTETERSDSELNLVSSWSWRFDFRVAVIAVVESPLILSCSTEWAFAVFGPVPFDVLLDRGAVKEHTGFLIELPSYLLQSVEDIVVRVQNLAEEKVQMAVDTSVLPSSRFVGVRKTTIFRYQFSFHAFFLICCFI
jgi:hypothetical protein